MLFPGEVHGTTMVAWDAEVFPPRVHGAGDSMSNESKGSPLLLSRLTSSRCHGFSDRVATTQARTSSLDEISTRPLANFCNAQ